MSPTDPPPPRVTPAPPAPSRANTGSSIPAAPRGVAQYAPTVGLLYASAQSALEVTPEWGQEPPQRQCSRYLLTPLGECLDPSRVAFFPDSDSPPRQAGAKNLALGLVLVTVGVLMVLFSGRSTRLAVLLTGLFLVASGLVSLLLGVLGVREEGALGQILVALLHLVLGAYMLGNRRTGATLLATMLAVWIVFKGFARDVLLVSSACGIILVLLVMRWGGLPGALLGYDLCVCGVFLAAKGAAGLRLHGHREARDSDPLVPERPPPPYSA